MCLERFTETVRLRFCEASILGSHHSVIEISWHFMHWFTFVNSIFQVRFVRVSLNIFFFFEEIEVNLEFLLQDPSESGQLGKIPKKVTIGAHCFEFHRDWNCIRLQDFFLASRNLKLNLIIFKLQGDLRSSYSRT